MKLVLEIPPITKMADVAKSASDIANKSGRVVFFTFNNVEVFAMPGDKPEDSIETYYIQCEMKHNIKEKHYGT